MRTAACGMEDAALFILHMHTQSIHVHRPAHGRTLACMTASRPHLHTALAVVVPTGCGQRLPEHVVAQTTAELLKQLLGLGQLQGRGVGGGECIHSGRHDHDVLKGLVARAVMHQN